MTKKKQHNVDNMVLPDNFERFKISEIKNFLTSYGIKIPRNIKKKNDLIEYVYRITRMSKIDKLVDEEKNNMLENMNDAQMYSNILNPLLNSYLEVYEIYLTMYLRWRDLGFPETYTYTNKAGATNESKHPLAQMVEVWSDKRFKALEKLGLTNKNLAQLQIIGGKVYSPAREDMMERPEAEGIAQLEAFRDKWRKTNGR